MARFLIATALFTVLAAAPAMASFTLIAPEPTAPGETSITAIPLTPNAANSMQQPVQPPANNAQLRNPSMIEMQPVPAPRTSMIAPQPQPSMMAPATLSTPSGFEPPVRGFGKDIPLVIAAQQVAPEGRQIAFAQGVDPSMPISWKGGQNWRNVLSDALSERGLQMVEQGNILFISPTSSMRATNASLMMEPKSASAQNNMPTQQPAYLPPTAPAPTAMNNNSYAPMAQQPTSGTIVLPTMEMPPANNAAYPSPTNPVVLPPPGSPITPVMAPAPRPLLPGENVFQPQSVGVMPATPMQSTIVSAPLAPVSATSSTTSMTTTTTAPLPNMTMAPPVPAITPIMPMNSVMDQPVMGSWQANSNRTLKNTLEDWSGRANVTLRWDSEYDYPVQSNVNFDGDYETAVRTLLRGFSSAQPQPIARLYRPTQGAPGVLLVTTRGNDMSTGR